MNIPDQLLLDISTELDEATATNAPFHSAHEGYAVILEEVDELWDEIKKKPANRNTIEMRKEAIQVAAMAIRFIMDGGL